MKVTNTTGPEMLAQLAAIDDALYEVGLTDDAAEALLDGQANLNGRIATAAAHAQTMSDETGVEFPNPLAGLESTNYPEDHPEDNSEVEPNPHSPELQERLGNLPEAMRTQVVSAHAQRVEQNDMYIEADLLPAEYVMPGLDMFVDRLEALVPSFEHMTTEDMTPSIEFPMLGLSDKQRSRLFAQHQTTRNGAWRSFHEDAVVDPTDRAKHFPEDMRHDVVVIDGSERPTVTNVSKDGTKGKNKNTAIQTARDLPAADSEASNEAVIAQATTNQASYDAIQLGRLELGEAPVDLYTWTMIRENALVGCGLRAVWASLDPNGAAVRSIWGNRDDALGYGGLRFAASGQEALALSHTA